MQKVKDNCEITLEEINEVISNKHNHEQTFKDFLNVEYELLVSGAVTEDDGVYGFSLPFRKIKN